MRLIRSKGVGVFFVTQTPKDVPGDVLAQLGNRVQHALRAFTPDDAKALKATASTFPNSSYDLEEVLTQLGIGEADRHRAVGPGCPDPGGLDPAAGAAVEDGTGRPRTADGGGRVLAAARRSTPHRSTATRRTSGWRPGWRSRRPWRQAPAPAPPAPQAPKAPRAPRPEKSTAEKVLESSAFKQAARSAAAALGREITRSIFGTRRR